ncbi:MAG TPA: ZIP family metal transporter [Firmicutes bacterium]|nr:ZIP family metal transporter [Bacillota bacterium]
MIAWLDCRIPHTHFEAGREGPSSRLARVWLLVLAITIHNFPEGLSVGVVFGSGDPGAGVVLAVAIGLQNMPEGLAAWCETHSSTRPGGSRRSVPDRPALAREASAGACSIVG